MIMEKPSNQELLATFPEAKQIIPEKIKEWKAVKAEIVKVVKQKLKIIKQKSAPQNQWFWRDLVKFMDMPAIVEVDKHINRLIMLKNLAENKPVPKGWLTPHHVEQARTVPVAEIAAEHTKLRRSGKTFVGLCPLHKEKTPSFTVYSQNNSWHCFGCNKHGDGIQLIRELLGLSFIEAVRSLIRN